MIKVVTVQMHAREKLRKELNSWLHRLWGGGAKSKMTMNLEFRVGRLLEPLAEVEVRQGSCFVGVEGLRLNFR